MRFFSTARPLLRIPPGAPSRITEIPVPRTARTTNDIGKYVDLPEPAPVAPRSAYVSQMIPETVDPSQLERPAGVWYNVVRSRSGRLPVYTDYNNAGGVWTEVRRISGDVGAFRDDLRAALDLPRKEIWVKNAAPVVVIKGNRASEVRSILSKMA